MWYTFAMDDTRRERLIGEWAARLERWGLTPVAPVLLQVLQPLGFLGSQAVLFGQPLLSLFADATSLEELSSLLDDADALSQIERRVTKRGSHAP
jgi:hypothetical protein